MPPPAFSVKAERLKLLIQQLHRISMLASRCHKQKCKQNWSLLRRLSRKKRPRIARRTSIAKFVLLRWDQLVELAHILVRQSRKRQKQVRIDTPTLKHALKEFGDSRLKTYAPFVDFLTDRGRTGRDFGMTVAWGVEGEPPASKKIAALTSKDTTGGIWCKGTTEMITAASHGRTEFLLTGKVKFIRRRSATKRGRVRPMKRAAKAHKRPRKA